MSREDEVHFQPRGCCFGFCSFGSSRASEATATATRGMKTYEEVKDEAANVEGYAAEDYTEALETVEDVATEEVEDSVDAIDAVGTDTKSADEIVEDVGAAKEKELKEWRQTLHRAASGIPAAATSTAPEDSANKSSVDTASKEEEEKQWRQALYKAASSSNVTSSASDDAAAVRDTVANATTAATAAAAGGFAAAAVGLAAVAADVSEKDTKDVVAEQPTEEAEAVISGGAAVEAASEEATNIVQDAVEEKAVDDATEEVAEEITEAAAVPSAAEEEVKAEDASIAAVAGGEEGDADSEDQGPNKDGQEGQEALTADEAETDEEEVEDEPKSVEYVEELVLETEEDMDDDDDDKVEARDLSTPIVSTPKTDEEDQPVGLFGRLYRSLSGRYYSPSPVVQADEDEDEEEEQEDDEENEEAGEANADKLQEEAAGGGSDVVPAPIVFPAPALSKFEAAMAKAKEEAGVRAWREMMSRAKKGQDPSLVPTEYIQKEHIARAEAKAKAVEEKEKEWKAWAETIRAQARSSTA